MTKSVTKARPAADPIELEILRNRLGSIGREACVAIERTATSPVLTEGKHYAVGIFDADGRLVSGGPHGYSGSVLGNSIRTTLARYGDDIRPGDVFFANDPHNGGGWHTGDPSIQRPIYFGDRRVGWAASYGHLIDTGGMVAGTFMPEATECYQEGILFPPVRLLRGGEEVSDVWDIIRNSVRLAEMVEMSIRALVAANNAVHDAVEALAAGMGADAFSDGLLLLCELSERELRRRIAEIPDGEYRALNFVEWRDEFHEVPCTLSVDGDRMVFDFEGCPPQMQNWMGAKEYVVKAQLASSVWHALARDLPFTEGIFAPLELRAPSGTMINTVPPAPVNSTHMAGAMVGGPAIGCALELAQHATHLMPDTRHGLEHDQLLRMGSMSTWAWTGPDGQPDTWLVLDGAYYGGRARRGRDGGDAGWRDGAGAEFPAAHTEMEILESWYPILIEERRLQWEAVGVGQWRAGSGVELAFRTHGVDHMVGQIMDMAEWLPSRGAAGGSVGVVGRRCVHRADGTTEEVSIKDTNIRIGPGDQFRLRTGSGAGYGDPLERELDLVQADLDQGKLLPAAALAAYGVVVDDDGRVDATATASARVAARSERLRQATPAVRPLTAADVEGMWDEGDATLPLYGGAGIVQRGRVAFVEPSGAPIAVAPDHWTDGCPVLEEPYRDVGPPVVVRSYLDPATGRALYVEAVPAGAPRSFSTEPRRWVGVART